MINCCPNCGHTEHIFGADQMGRDIFSRIIHGARISLAVGLGSTALGSLFAGTDEAPGEVILVGWLSHA